MKGWAWSVTDQSRCYRSWCELDLKNCFSGGETCVTFEGTVAQKLAVHVALQHGLDFTMAVKQTAMILADVTG
jgi:hypothetical protein